MKTTHLQKESNANIFYLFIYFFGILIYAEIRVWPIYRIFFGPAYVEGKIHSDSLTPTPTPTPTHTHTCLGGSTVPAGLGLRGSKLCRYVFVMTALVCHLVSIFVGMSSQMDLIYLTIRR